MEGNYSKCAGVAELGDASGLGPGGLTAVGVRVPPPAPFNNYYLEVYSAAAIRSDNGVKLNPL